MLWSNLFVNKGEGKERESEYLSGVELIELISSLLHRSVEASLMHQLGTIICLRFSLRLALFIKPFFVFEIFCANIFSRILVNIKAPQFEGCDSRANCMLLLDKNLLPRISSTTKNGVRLKILSQTFESALEVVVSVRTFQPLDVFFAIPFNKPADAAGIVNED